MLTEVRSAVRRADPGCRESLNQLVSSPPALMGKAQHLARPPAFIPNMTIVLLQASRRLIYVTGKNKTRTVKLIRYPDCHGNLQIIKNGLAINLSN